VAGLQQSDPALEEAARSLGANPIRVLRRIAIPLIGANLAAGCILAFAFAMLEVSDSLILAQQTQHYPITKAIYSLLSTLGNGTELAAALGVWAMVFLTVSILGAALLGGKRGGLFKV
jgi:iron(III) transport system permease protein